MVAHLAEAGSPGNSDGCERHPLLLIVSEIRLFSEGLAEALGRHSPLSVVGHCMAAREALAKLADLPLDIVLLDASMPGGLALVGQARKLAPKVSVVVLALNETTETVVAWGEAGAAGYIPKTTGLADVVSILLDIQQGKQVCSPAVAAGLFRRLHKLPTIRHNMGDHVPSPALTARETEILELISDGLSNKDIARQLKIGVSTTKSHVHNLLAKLNVPQRGQAVVRMRDRLNLSV
jgi:two-component system, NarL family, nitrate/nitrite response regulator NarL